MEYLTSISKKLPNDTIICIGFFDGFHQGHLEIINQTLKIGQENNLKTIFFTFKNKFRNNKVDKNAIFSNAFKQNFIKSKNFDYYYEFDLETKSNAHIDKLTFLDLLKNNLRVKKIVLGQNFNFGYQGKGNAKDVKNYFGATNAKILDLLLIDNHFLSSSFIKQLMLNGEITRANKLLVSNYFCQGKVTRHNQLGRKLNFPTANIILNSKLLIKEGSYITRTYLGNDAYNSITYYASKENYFIVETYIIDFDMNIYDEKIKIEFIKFLKENQQFKNIHLLKAHISWCYKKALAFFKK